MPKPSHGCVSDQEEIAVLFAEYDLLALPVVDDERRPIGLVTIDDVVDVMQDEATQDMYEMAAIISDELEDQRSTIGAVRRRLPWLLVCLAGTLVSGVVIQVFSESSRLSSLWVWLTVFMPAIMAMGGNSGIQTSTVTVRSLATGDLVAGQLLAALARELRVALGLGVLLGLLVLAVAYAWTNDHDAERRSLSAYLLQYRPLRAQPMALSVFNRPRRVH